MRLLSTIGLAVLASGCAAVDLDFRRPIPWMKGEDPSQASRMVTIWTDTVRTEPGKTGRRGYGGRVMFYKAGSERPVKAEGKLTVFAFDDTEGDSGHCVPDKKYVFTPEQFARLYSKSELGHSYSVWLPWDEVGGPQRKVALIARFETSDGALITSEMTSQILPGTKHWDEHSPHAPPFRALAAVQQAGHQVPVVNEPRGEERARMTTTTIPLGPHFGQPSWTGGEQAAAMVDAYGGHEPQGLPPGSGGMEPRLLEGAGGAGGPMARGMASLDYVPGGEARFSGAPLDRADPADSSPPNGFVPGRLRVRGGPIARPRPSRAEMRPHPVGWPSGHSE